MIQAESMDEEGYWIGFTVDEYENIPKGMTTLTIPAQMYASIEVKGVNTTIRPAYHDLHQWMKTEGLPPVLSRWHVEKYTKWGNKEEIQRSNRTIERKGEYCGYFYCCYLPVRSLLLCSPCALS
ncbi:GyrI-like domain-containing protein [Halobacillus sp. A5]|uniref:GyrI-like domain-containing protein n=1 Tax=Halobacillus sp. A5 TaxID=2880263 RepID=UPI00353231C9